MMALIEKLAGFLLTGMTWLISAFVYALLLAFVILLFFGSDTGYLELLNKISNFLEPLRR